MSIRLASNSIRIMRQGFMGFKFSCSIGALAVLGVVFAGGTQSYAGVAYAHFGQDEGQKVTAVQSAAADLPRLDLVADPASVGINRQIDNVALDEATSANHANVSSTGSPATQWLAKWDTSSAESSSVSGNLRTSKPASSEQDADSMQVRPLAIPTPSAWSAGIVGLIGLGLARVAYRARSVRRNCR